jgi:rhamnose transport system permease protein
MKAFTTWERALAGLLLILYVGFGLGIDGFLSPYALADSTVNMSERLIIAMAMAMLIVAGEIDLSIAATMALSSLAMGLAMQAGAPLPLMLLAAVATGAACGLLNGWLVTLRGLPSIVVTIGTLSLYRGLALVLLGDQAVAGYPQALSVLGNGTLGDLFGVDWLIVPIEFAIALLFAGGVAVWMHRTVHGRRVYAIGSNPVAARFSGIAAERYRLGLFVFAGIAAALAAVLLTGRIGSTRPNLAAGWELDAITIALLGGVAIQGGRGSMVGVMLAALLLGAFSFGLGMLNVPGIVVSTILGGLLIVAMLLPRVWARRAAQ